MTITIIQIICSMSTTIFDLVSKAVKDERYDVIEWLSQTHDNFFTTYHPDSKMTIMHELFVLDWRFNADYDVKNYEAKENARAEIIRKLLSHPNCTTDSLKRGDELCGISLLHRAVMSLKIFEVLVESGKITNDMFLSVDDINSTFLHHACIFSCKDVVEYVLFSDNFPKELIEVKNSYENSAEMLIADSDQELKELFECSRLGESHEMKINRLLREKERLEKWLRLHQT